MDKRRKFDQLDEGIEAIIARPDSPPPADDAEISELLHVAAELRTLPTAEFKARLKAELQEQAGVETPLAKGGPISKALKMSATDLPDFLPTLFGTGYGNYPVQHANFAASFLLHTAALALLVSSGFLVVQHRQALATQVTTLITEPSPYVPPAPDRLSGGGGGGDHDKLEASKGAAPRFAAEQLSPPAIVIRNESPKLTVQPTLVGPPDIKLPAGPVGNPLAGFTTASNGPGFGGGIGSGSGGGIGSGSGPGLGPGSGGGTGGGVYRVGGGVSQPRVIFDPDPDYTEAARKAKLQGKVLLWGVITADGRPRDLKVVRSLGMGLDEKAIEAVRNWKFQPAMKDGQPVAVQIGIEVSFRLY